ncbi:MAG TPA: hypothetical protein VGS62_01495 [Streptosporangiaceae bacterium]|nr:hypothetical protein [Streptosporangiaceae bacterium]
MTPARRLAVRLGLDGNALRRRTDRIASCGAAVLLVAFLAGAPLLSVAGGGWTAHALAAQQRAGRGQHQVTAVLVQNAPYTVSAGWVVGSWAVARWTAPAGHHHIGLVEAMGATPAGTRVRIWVDAAGRVSEPPLSHPAVAVLVGGAMAAAPVMLAITLLGVAFIGRRLLDRQRLAAWETDWNAVGPQWTRQFRARG